MREKITCLVAVSLLLTVAHVCLADNTVKQIIIDKNTQSSIVISNNPSDTEKYAAEELQFFIRKMADINIPIRNEGHAANGISFIVGRCKETKKYLDKFDKRLTGPGSDSFLIMAKGNQIVLIGGGDRGTLYSVYAMLEKQGCRWFMPGELGEVIPERERLLIDECEELEVPDFIQRELQGPYALCSDDEKLTWQARNRINRENDFTIQMSRNDERWRKRGNYLNWSRLFHNYPHILPPLKYFQEHPEYYALYKGQRIKAGHSKGSVCTTNSEVIDRFVEYINNWFKSNPDGSVFSLWPPDGAIRWCECDKCMELGGRNFTSDPAAMSRRHITFVNEIARRVYKTYPDRLILLCAYHPNYLDPVMDMKLEKNVIVQVIHDGCHAHGLDKCAANLDEKRRLENWAKIAQPGLGSPGFSEIPLLAWDEYGLSPRPVARRIIDNLKYIHSIGSRYYYAQTGTVHKRKDTIYYSPFPFYVLTKYTWDVNTNYGALCDDFFSKFYGKAWDPMKKYWNLLEDAVQGADYWHPQPWSEGALPSGEVYTPEVLIEAEKYVHEAEKLAETPIIKKRVSYIRESLEFIKASVGKKTTFKVEKKDDYYVFNEGKSIANDNIINSSQDNAIRTSVFRSLETKFPVVRIENDRVVVSLVPGIGGRMVGILDKKTGTNFMYEPVDKVSVYKLNAYYLVYGGYEELIGTKFPSPGWELPYSYKMAEEDKFKKIVMKSDIDNFGIERTISLQKGDLPDVTIDTKITNNSAEGRSVGLSIHPVMQINRSLESLYLSMIVEDGTIKKGHITLGLNDKPYGIWAVTDEKANVGIINFFDPVQASAKLHLAFLENSFNMQLVGTEHRLGRGEFFTFSHSYKVMDDAAKQIETEFKIAKNALLLREPNVLKNKIKE